MAASIDPAGWLATTDDDPRFVRGGRRLGFWFLALTSDDATAARAAGDAIHSVRTGLPEGVSDPSELPPGWSVPSDGDWQSAVRSEVARPQFPRASFVQALIRTIEREGGQFWAAITDAGEGGTGTHGNDLARYIAASWVFEALAEELLDDTPGLERLLALSQSQHLVLAACRRIGPAGIRLFGPLHAAVERRDITDFAAPAALGALARNDEAALRMLARRLDAEGEAAWTAANALASAGEAALRTMPELQRWIRDAASDADPDRRARAARLLCGLGRGTEWAEQILLERLRDGEPVVVGSALVALAGWPAPPARAEAVVGAIVQAASDYEEKDHDSRPLEHVCAALAGLPAESVARLALPFLMPRLLSRSAVSGHDVVFIEADPDLVALLERLGPAAAGAADVVRKALGELEASSVAVEEMNRAEEVMYGERAGRWSVPDPAPLRQALLAIGGAQ